MSTFVKSYKQHAPIIFLVVLAAFLRLFHLFDLQYTYDELSAVNRLEFNSFHELVSKGIIIDAHPALIQVWMYYYAKLFGTTEWLMKLPFIVCGIASVFIIYRISKRWFNETSGLISATILACAQYFVFYSVVARPYISGLLLSLFVLKYWLELIFDQSPKLKHYVLFAVFAALAALNHHFSMMFAALCGLIGLLFLTKQNYKFYLLSCVLAVLLYSPHFTILFAQLKIGGIGAASGGWLNPPENTFIIDFVRYLFHYSYLFVFVFIGVIAFSYFKENLQSSKLQNKIRVVLFLLFASSFLIGFFYSLYVNPVIQFSTLIFSAPCLLLFLSSFAGETSLQNKWITISLIAGISISTLVMKRHYYDLIYNQSFDTYIKTANQIIKEKGQANVYCLFKGEPWFLNFYKKKYQSNAMFEVIENETKTIQDYKTIYDTLKATYLVLGDFNPAQLLQASLYYPYVYQKTTGYGFELYVLSKEKAQGDMQTEELNIITTNFISIPNGFNVNRELIVKENNQTYYKVDSTNEYPLSFKIKNKDLKCKEGQSLLAKMRYTSPKILNAALCSSTDANSKNIHWTENNLNSFYKPQQEIQTAYVSVYVGQNFNDEENEITLFIWNREKENMKILDFTISTWDNNKFRYGLLSDF